MKRKMTREDYRKLDRVVNRIYAEGLNYTDRVSTAMDIEATYESTTMGLDKLLGFDRFNFAHDIIGIANNINRRTRKLDNCFLPRCA